MNTNKGWKGRQPGLFVPENIKVDNGTLQLWANYTSYPPSDGYCMQTISVITNPLKIN